MSFELDEKYPLKPEVEVPSHDMSKGLRRHFPACYDERGRYIEIHKPFPFVPCVALMAGIYIIARVVL